MKQYPILNEIPGLRNKVHPADLIRFATPIHALKTKNGRLPILVKREDQTDTETYGGNKVRNLEFVLGEALHRHCDEVSTLIAYGSNFTAALAAQTEKLGLKAHLSQFVMKRNPQIESHVRFGKNHGAKMSTYDFHGFGLPLATLHAAAKASRLKTYFIQPGASSVLGALGHANALLETVRQFKDAKKSLPNRIIVGAGTCGTLAGLIVGVHLSGEDVRITGVRCADPRVCSPRRVAALANRTLRFIGSSYRVRAEDIEIVDSPGPKTYAKTSPEIFTAIEEFQSRENITLDTTYTAKVILHMNSALQTKQYEGQLLLYWHTFSPKAV